MECVFTLSVLVTLLAVVETVQGGKCPANPTQAMQACAQKVSIDLSIAEGHKFITDPEYNQKMCKGKKVHEAIECMEKIYNDCKGEGMVDQDLMIKPVAWRAAVKMLCDNSKFLDENSACVRQSGQDMVKCVEDYSKQAQAEFNLKNIDVAAKAKGKHRKVFKIVCSLSKNLIQCFDNTLHKQCPKKMEQLMNDVFYMFLPPVCHPEDATYKFVKDDEKPKGGSTSSYSPLLPLLVLCLFALLL